MTTAFLDALAAQPRANYPTLLLHLETLLSARGFGQSPQVSSTHPFSLDRVFGLTDAPTAGSPLGPVVRVPKAPSVPRHFAGGFGEMIASAEMSGLIAGALLASHGNGHHPNSFAPPPAPTGGDDGGGSWFGGLFGGGRSFDADGGQDASPTPLRLDPDTPFQGGGGSSGEEDYGSGGSMYDDEGDFDDAFGDDFDE